MSSSSAWMWLPNLTALLVYAVWLVGIAIALARWGRHPRVSAIIVASLAGLLVLNVAHRVGSSWIIHRARSAGQPIASIGVYLGILALVTSLLRAGAWGAVLVALFGWRPAPPGIAATQPRFQFSIRGLMILTLAVAVLCGLVRGLIFWLGESAAFLLNLIDDVPNIVCWIVGMRVALRRWPAHPEVSKFALFGIWIRLLTLVFWQVAWLVLVTSLRPRPINLLAVPLTVLSASAWVLILIAVFGWREAAAPPQAGEVLGAGRSAGGVPS